MVCKNCGFEIEKGWKYCPNCSKRTSKKQMIILIGIIMLVIILFIVFSIKNAMPVNEKYIEKQLEKKYNEDFSDISLVENVKNPDTDLNCGGSSFGTIKGEGSTIYYKVYSRKNDLEFLASYDTSDRSKEITDSYEQALKKRTTLVEAYNIINKYLYMLNYTFTLSGFDDGLNIYSENQLQNILSKYEVKNRDLEDIEISINENLYDFCKSNYEIITKLNDDIVTLQKTNEYYFSTTIHLNSNTIIELYRLDDKAYVYDKYDSSKSWGEPLDKFVTREDY